MYNNLLESDDVIKISNSQRVDIQDYVNMRKQVLPTVVKWATIRSNIVTKNGVTLWQLSEKHLNDLEQRAIGQLESPVSLFEFILK